MLLKRLRNIILANLYEISSDDLLRFIADSNAPDSNISTQDKTQLSSYLEYFNNPMNQKKYQYHTVYEKELLYYYQMLPDSDKKELIEIAKIKARKR